MHIKKIIYPICIFSLALSGYTGNISTVQSFPITVEAASLSNTTKSTDDSTQTQNLLTQLTEIAEKNRQPYRLTVGPDKYKSFQKLLTQNLDPKEDSELAARIESQKLTEFREPKSVFSYDEAIQDVEFLFEYMKYGYSGYGYFGGDDVYLPLKQTIISKLKSASEENPKNNLTNDTFKNILAECMTDVISDGHFSIGGIQLLRANVYCYLSKELLLAKDEYGYYIISDKAVPTQQKVTEEKVYFDGIDMSQIQKLVNSGMKKEIANELERGNYDNFIKPTIDENGMIVYTISVSSIKDFEDIPLIINLKNSDGAQRRKISLKRVKFENYLHEMNRQLFEENKIYRTYTNKGVKIIEMRSFYSPNNDSKQLEQFVKDAESFKDEDYLIIDLRRNGGGNSKYAFDWLKNFTGAEDFGLGIGSTLLTKTVRSTLSEDLYGSSDMLNYYDEFYNRNTIPGWDYFEVTEPEKKIEPIANDTKIFVITDLAIASAAENFIAFLQTLDNVYFVGTNTWGVSTFGNIRPLYLPNTALEINCCFNISLLPDLGKLEGEGFQPDLWVDTNDSVDATLKLIENLKAQSNQYPKTNN